MGTAPGQTPNGGPPLDTRPDAGPWRMLSGEVTHTQLGLELRNSVSDGFLMPGIIRYTPEWRDGVFAFRVRLTSVGEDWRDGVWAGVRCTPEGHGYVVGFYAGRVSVYKILFGDSVTGTAPMAQARSKAAGLRDGQWHKVTITAKDNALTVTLDGERMLRTRDRTAGGVSPLGAGGVALAARKWTRSKTDTVALFDDIRVEPVGGGTPRAGPGGIAVSRRPWARKAVYPTYAEYTATLQWWADTHAKLAQLETVGHSVEGVPIYCLRITDADSPDRGKHIILVSALDSGGERSGTCAALRTVEWLLGNSTEAATARRTHIVLFMPIVNPWGYERGVATNSLGINTYAGGRSRGSAWDVARLELRAPETTPEIAAFKTVVDQWQPDVVFDLHGVGLDYAGQLVQPSVGSAVSNISNRPWDRRLLEDIIRYAGKLGFGFNRMEVDAQQLFGGEQTAPLDERFWIGRPFFYTAVYAYARFHSMLLTTEVAWEQGAVALVRGLLATGARGTEHDPVPALPVNAARYVYGPYTVQAYGTDLAARRTSRVELWQNQEAITLGFLYNYVDGREAVVCTLGRSGLLKLTGDMPKNTMPRVNVVDALRTLRKCGDVDIKAVERFLLSGPQRVFALDVPRRVISDKPDAITAWHPEHGMALHFPLFYPNVSEMDVRLNGHRLPKGPVSGDQTWFRNEDGYTTVRVNIPPEMTAKQDLFLVTCAYTPPERRSYGWETPAAVRRRMAEHLKERNRKEKP